MTHRTQESPLLTISFIIKDTNQENQPDDDALGEVWGETQGGTLCSSPGIKVYHPPAHQFFHQPGTATEPQCSKVYTGTLWVVLLDQITVHELNSISRTLPLLRDWDAPKFPFSNYVVSLSGDQPLSWNYLGAHPLSPPPHDVSNHIIWLFWWNISR